MPDHSVLLDDYVCERRDRTDGRGGGVTCYMKNNLSLHDLEKDSFEVCWLKLEPKRLPHIFSKVVVGCIYHPPGGDNSLMRDYVLVSIDCILRKHPDCGIILAGDFNQLRDTFLRSQYGFNQVVQNPTKHRSIFDKIWTSMCVLYDKPKGVA